VDEDDEVVLFVPGEMGNDGFAGFGEVAATGSGTCVLPKTCQRLAPKEERED
jgi:hypothetical protein